MIPLITGSRLSGGIPLRTKTSRFEEVDFIAISRSLMGVGEVAILPVLPLSYGGFALICTNSQRTTVKTIGNIRARTMVDIGAL